MPRTRSADPISRKALLAAAAKIIQKKGVSGASISMICKEAGYPASSLYWHFVDKDELIAAVAKEQADIYIDEAIRLPLYGLGEETDQSTWEKQFEHITDDKFVLMMKILCFMMLESDSTSPKTQELVKTARKIGRKYWTAALKQLFHSTGNTTSNIIAEEYADFCMASFTGIAVGLSFGETIDFNKCSRNLYSLLNSLRKNIEYEKKLPKK